MILQAGKITGCWMCPFTAYNLDQLFLPIVDVIKSINKNFYASWCFNIED